MFSVISRMTLALSQNTVPMAVTTIRTAFGKLLWCGRRKFHLLSVTIIIVEWHEPVSLLHEEIVNFLHQVLERTSSNYNLLVHNFLIGHFRKLFDMTYHPQVIVPTDHRCPHWSGMILESCDNFHKVVVSVCWKSITSGIQPKWRSARHGQVKTDIWRFLKLNITVRSIA